MECKVKGRQAGGPSAKRNTPYHALQDFYLADALYIGSQGLQALIRHVRQILYCKAKVIGTTYNFFYATSCKLSQIL